MSRRIVLIEYYFTATRLFAFAVRSDFEQPAVMEIAVDVTALQSELRGVLPQLEVRIEEVVRWPALVQCVAPILEWTAPGDLVCIVPSGPLFYIPLHAVSAAGGPLMLRNPIFYAPSSSALRYCIRRRQANEPMRTPTVFGNPEGDLISSGREAEAVAELLGVTALLRDEVTRENWRKAMTSSDMIHLCRTRGVRAGRSACVGSASRRWRRAARPRFLRIRRPPHPPDHAQRVRDRVQRRPSR
jgi:hypothetical protein